MGLNVTLRKRSKQDYQIAAIAAGVSFVLSIVALIVHIKTEEN